MACSLIDFMPY
jgi:hypothetical protein